MVDLQYSFRRLLLQSYGSSECPGCLAIRHTHWGALEFCTQSDLSLNVARFLRAREKIKDEKPRSPCVFAFAKDVRCPERSTTTREGVAPAKSSRSETGCQSTRSKAKGPLHHRATHEAVVSAGPPTLFQYSVALAFSRIQDHHSLCG